MSVAVDRHSTTKAPAHDRPRLVYFHQPSCGRCRRVEGFLAAVLAARRNHATFVVHAVSSDARPDLVERFEVTEFPTLVVVEGKRVQGRLVAPKGIAEIELLLARWLR